MSAVVSQFPSPRAAAGEGDSPRASGERGQPEPERRLRALFRSEARAERRLAEVRFAIAAERRRYAAKHSLGFLPALDVLRRLFG